jgi:hypothetical protein
VTAWAVAAAYNRELAGRRKQALHTVLVRMAEEVVAPIEIAHKLAAGAVHSTEEVAAPIVAVHKAVVVVLVAVAHRVIEVARMAAVVADSDLAAAAGLDHKT